VNLNRRHLEHVLRVYTHHYNRQRPHRALALRPPNPATDALLPASGQIQRRDRLGGLIHEYYRAAARRTQYWRPWRRFARGRRDPCIANATRGAASVETFRGFDFASIYLRRRAGGWTPQRLASAKAYSLLLLLPLRA
jgi:hypothetical protein